jgi:hypothetical protein
MTDRLRDNRQIDMWMVNSRHRHRQMDRKNNKPYQKQNVELEDRH